VEAGSCEVEKTKTPRPFMRREPGAQAISVRQVV
jgi:hypothetical protein